MDFIIGMHPRENENIISTKTAALTNVSKSNVN
jgi:hypothetical protein